MTLLKAETLTLTAGARTLCRDLELSIEAGSLWAVLGRNGSGKSTLMHALAGLVAAADGRVTVAGSTLGAYSRRELARTLGILLQREDQEYWGTLADYVALGRYAHARSFFGWQESDAQAGAGAMAAFDVQALAQQAYRTLSGGERQRARLAQLWAQAPRVLLLDEPLQHLDLRHQVAVLAELKRAIHSGERAAVVVLHDLTFVRRFDHVLMLYGDGRYAAGTASDLLQGERLEALYGCRVRSFGTGADEHFVPVI